MAATIVPTTLYLKNRIAVPLLRPALVPRPRLMGELQELVQGKAVALVSAPAGFGKSTLVAAWCHGSQTQTAWLAVEKVNVPGQSPQSLPAYHARRGTRSLHAAESALTQPGELPRAPHWNLAPKQGVS